MQIPTWACVNLLGQNVPGGLDSHWNQWI